jgi:tetratricopeptide (TPR) repeat protein
VSDRGDHSFPASLISGRGLFLVFSYIVAIILFCAAGAYAQGRESAEIGFSKAILLYDDKKYAEATQELLKAYRLDPRNTDIIYYLGLSLSAQGNYPEAEAYLRKGLALDPKNSDLQYLLAYALQAQGKMQAARELAESLQLEPASPLVGPTRQLLGALRTPRRGETPFWLELTARAQYDSNVSLKPNNGALAPGLGNKSSWGNLLALAGDYAFLRSERWQAGATYDALQTLNYENHDFDFSEQTPGARVTYNNLLPGGQRFFLTGRAFYDVLLQSGRLFLQRPTGSLDFFLLENPANGTELFYQLQGKIFNDHPPRPPNGKGDEDRDALNHLVGVVHRMFFSGGRHQINFGYHFDREEAQGKNWRYNGHKGVAGVMVTLPWEIRATTNFEFHARRYDGTNTGFGESRKDDETTVLFSLAKDITPKLTATLEHLWDSNHSSIANFRYQRQIFSFGVTWRYY